MIKHLHLFEKFFQIGFDEILVKISINSTRKKSCSTICSIDEGGGNITKAVQAKIIGPTKCANCSLICIEPNTKIGLGLGQNNAGELLYFVIFKNSSKNFAKLCNFFRTKAFPEDHQP